MDMEIGDCEFVDDLFDGSINQSMSIFNEVALHGCHSLDTTSQSLLLDQDASNTSLLLNNNLDGEDQKDISHFSNSALVHGLQTAGLEENPSTCSQPVTKILEEIDSTKSTHFYPGPTAFSKESIWSELEAFWQFYIEIPERRRELKPILIYILLHLYHHCVRYHSIMVARKLCIDFKKLLQEEKCDVNYKAVVAAMRAPNSDVFNQDPMLKPFIHNESPFLLSTSTFSSLQSFLSRKQSSVLLHLFVDKIVLKSKQGSLLTESYRQNLKEKEQLENLLDSKSDDVSILSVKKSISTLRGDSMSPNIPPVSIYMSNGDPCCGDISICNNDTEPRLAFGILTGGLRLYSHSDATDVSNESLESPEASTKFTPLCTLNGHRGSIYDIAFHPISPNFLFSAGEDSTLRCWQLSDESKDSNCKCLYKGHNWPIWSVSISPRGNYIGTSSMDRSLRIWVPERTQYVRLLAGHYMDVLCSTFHPNEAYIASGSIDRTVRLWSVANGETVRVFTGAESPVTSVLFHEGGDYIIGGCEDRNIRIWDIPSGELIAQIPCDNKIFNLAMWKHYIAAGCDDGNIWFWNVKNIVGGNGHDLDLEDSSGSEDDEKEDEESVVIPEPICIPTAAGNVLRMKYLDGKRFYALGSTV